MALFTSRTGVPATNNVGRGTSHEDPRPTLRLLEGNSILDSREQNMTTVQGSFVACALHSTGVNGCVLSTDTLVRPSVFLVKTA